MSGRLTGSVEAAVAPLTSGSLPPGLSQAVVAVLLAAAVVVAPGRRGALPSPELEGSDAGRRGPLARVLAGPGKRTASAVSVNDVVESLVLLALAFRSGLPTCDVLDAVSARAGDAVAADLRQVAAALRWGASEAEAWAAVDARWTPAARAISLAGRAGVPPGPLLLRAADDLSQGELERLEVSAAKVTVRLVLPLGLVLLPAFVLTTVLPIVAALARQVLTAA